MPLLDTPLGRELERQGRRRDWMAAQLGVKPWTYSKIEAGKLTTPEGWYERAADALGVGVEVILPPSDTCGNPSAVVRSCRGSGGVSSLASSEEAPVEAADTPAEQGK